jgi:hypothetical protein
MFKRESAGERLKQSMQLNFQAVLIFVLLGSLLLPFGFSVQQSFFEIHCSGSIAVGGTRALHVDGRFIKNDLNQTVYLRGVNKAEFTDDSTGWWPPAGEGIGDGYGVWDEAAVRTTLQDMRQNWGINLVRLIVYTDWWQNNTQATIGGQPANRPYKECIKDFIRLCDEYGIYVMIAWWGHAVSQDAMPYPGAFPTANDFVNFWTGFAVELRTAGVINNVVFDLWNEPDPSDFAEYMATCKQIIDELRTRGINNIVLVQIGFAWSINWLADPACLPLWQNGTATAKNVIFGEHIYRASGTFYGRPGLPNDAYLYNDVKSYLESHGYRHYAQDENLSILVGEIGAWYGNMPNADPHELDCFNNSLTILNEWNINYAAWQWQRADGVWAIQKDLAVPLPPNNVGEVLIKAIATGKSMG